MKRGRLALGAAVFFCLAPGGVAGLVPFLVSGWRRQSTLPAWARAVGAALVVVGLASVLESFARFVLHGHGTPAPAAPPRRLVVSGQYRFVRNPMYAALVLIVLGQAAWFGSRDLVLYAVALLVLFHLRVLVYEEPRLAARFGAGFDAYRKGVPRWLPRLTPWRASDLNEHCDPEDVVRELVRAWNRGDTRSFAALFAPHAEYVTGAGRHVRGREGIAALLEGAGQPIVTAGAPFIETGGPVATARFAWSTAGDRGRPRRGTIRCALTRHGAGWLIESLRNDEETSEAGRAGHERARAARPLAKRRVER
jgi:protein-S-isoprenylcysteine O-methyltransferase Ste14